MSKFYAVKKGRISGIYTSWSECQKQTSGFSGAIYKSFTKRGDAEAYLSKDKNEITINDQEEFDKLMRDLNTVMVFTDGSERPSVNHKGSGAYCNYNGKDYFLSVTCTNDIVTKYNITTGIEILSNPTMEFLAVAEVLCRFISVNCVFNRKNKLKLVIWSDYLGCKEWLSREWNTEAEYTTKIKNNCLVMIDYLKKKGVDVFVGHIKGHTKGLWFSHGNDMSDKAAKSQQDFDTFPTLVKDIQQ